MICNLASYRRIVGDYSSFDGDVVAALTEAQTIVEDRTRRFFEQATRTETLNVYQNGTVYPHAYPLVSVSSPTGTTIVGNGVRYTSWITWDPTVNNYFNSLDGYNNFDNPNFRPTVAVTYIGGYAAGLIPPEAVRVTAEIAQLSLNPATDLKIPIGATSVTVGDVSISGKSLGGISALPSSILKTLNRLRYREAN